MSLSNIVVLARAGATPETIVEAWRRDGARLKLHPADIVDLHASGVSYAILDALQEAREVALRIDYDSRLVAQQTSCQQQLASERARVPVCPAPPLLGAASLRRLGFSRWLVGRGCMGLVAANS